MAVKFNKETLHELEEMITEFFRSAKVSLSAPVDIFAVATRLGFDVRGASFDEPLEGLIVVNEREKKLKGFDSNKVIAYNCTKSIEEKKFIVAHELAHYIFEKQTTGEARLVLGARDHENSYSDDEKEQKMDYLAAAMLVPKDDISSFLTANPDSTANSVAERYKVSVELAKRRMEEVRA